MLETKEEAIYVDLESYKGFYNDVEKDGVYRISTKSGVLPGLYQFVEDKSGDSCENCALKDVQSECQTCFECFNLSAKKYGEKKMEENIKTNAWELELTEIESQISSLEEVIKDKADELKDLKKSLEALYERLKNTVALGSKGYAESHPLFDGIEEE